MMPSDNTFAKPNIFMCNPSRLPSTRRMATDRLLRCARQCLVACYRPCLVFWPCTLFGLLLWSLPLQYGCGITRREELTLSAVALLLAWYGGLSMSAWLGERIAAATPVVSLPRFNEMTFYVLATLVALVGVSATWYTVIKAGVPLSEVIANSSGNDFKAAVYDNYSFWHTLRYGAALSGGIALFRLLFRDRRHPLDFLNVALMLGAAIISARLVLVQSVFIACGTAVKFGGFERVKFGKLLAFAGLALAALTAMTWLREAGYYQRFDSGQNPAAAQILHIRRYLGAPFQGALGTARIAMEEPDRYPNPRSVWKNAIPTFLHSAEEKQVDASGHNQWTVGKIDIDLELSTNSALAQLYGDMGNACFPFMGIVALSGAWWVRVMWKFNHPLFFVSLILLYAFFELWRMFLFNQGFVCFLVAEIAACAVGSAYLPFRHHDSQRFLANTR